MTSNVGADLILDAVNASADNGAACASGVSMLEEASRKQILGEVRRCFRPEFLNRLSDIILFNPLGKEQLRLICQKQLDDVGARLSDKDIRLEFTTPAADWVIQEAYDPAYGARPLQRYVEKEVVTELSYLVIRGELLPHSMVRVVLDDSSQQNKLGYEVTRLFNEGDA